VSNRFSDVIERFADRRVLVLGEAMLDCYLEGSTSRLCQEAPVPVVGIESRRDVPGGAANTAINVRALGAVPAFLSVVGDDCEGRLLRAILDAHGITAETIALHPGRQTLAKHRVVAGSHLLVRFDQGSTSPMDEQAEHFLLERLISLHRHCDAIVVSDYGYGILTPRVIRCLTHLQRRNPKVLVVDSKSLARFRAAGVAAVKPNFVETLKLLELNEPAARSQRIELIEVHGEHILAATGARLAAVTLDIDGAIFFEPGQSPYRTYARPLPQSQAAGAGDTFLAAMTLALACGADTQTTAEIASAAAAVVVAKEGTASCDNDELLDQLCTAEKLAPNRERLAARCSLYRHHGKRVVLTNGCFDILHSGHVAYLNQAKALGDILIVGVNSDESVRRLKGPRRPINRIVDRVQVLSALSSIDHLIVFDENTPAALIESLRPHVFVKGGDYTRSKIPEAAAVERSGGEVRILPFVENRSTTNIIKRIADLASAPQPPRYTLTCDNGHDQSALENGSQHFVR
jgi:D-beta-D-heptose 7-phosphate kinase/D-beta-D-heptose 1-phosphate adenosyltransferase